MQNETKKHVVKYVLLLIILLLVILDSIIIYRCIKDKIEDTSLVRDRNVKPDFDDRAEDMNRVKWYYNHIKYLDSLEAEESNLNK